MRDIVRVYMKLSEEQREYVGLGIICLQFIAFIIWLSNFITW